MKTVTQNKKIMKTRTDTKAKTLLLAFAVFISQCICAHGKISIEAENLWRYKGIVVNLIAAKESRQMKEHIFTRFLGMNSVEIQNDKKYYFDNSGHRIDSLEVWLAERNQWYSQSLDSFLANPENLRDIDQTDQVSSSSSVATIICDNIDFEDGTSVSDFNANWTLKSGVACSGLGCNSFGSVTVSSLTLDDPSTRYSITSSGFDPNIQGGSLLPTVNPDGGTYSLRLENYANGGDAMQLSRTILVDVSKPFFKYSYAAVLEDPGSDHADADKPYFYVQIKDAGGDVISCTKYMVVANPASAELRENFIYDNSSGKDLYYRYWTDVIIPLDAHVGTNVTVEFVVSDCAWGGHMAYVYLDGSCLDESITAGTCAGTPNQKRTLTAPDGFIKYWWNGPFIIGSNSRQAISAYKAGTYFVDVTTRGGCTGRIEAIVTACSTTTAACTLSVSNIDTTTCDNGNNLYTLTGDISLGASTFLTQGVIGITVGNITRYLYAPFSSGFSFGIPDIYTQGGSVNYSVKYYPDQFTGTPTCSTSGTFTSPQPCVTREVSCENCIGSFKPESGKTYVVSAWVKDNSVSLATATTYSNPYIEISFNSGGTVLSPVYASGRIIDGWQRIYYEFTVPGGATEISIALKTSSGTADFDDIRVHPVDAGFTSYVYDPVSLKLVAVLDDNNYATFYEYDLEGTLVRTKKETERGVMTITESRENSPKR